jgi:CHAT domain-containing protein
LDVTFDSIYKQLLTTLEIGGIDLLHFSTHGQSDKDNPFLSTIELEEGIQFRPEDIGGGRRKFGQSYPLVILNACQTGYQGFSLTGIQGWATKFLGAGASVFIGTLVCK